MQKSRRNVERIKTLFCNAVKPLLIERLTVIYVPVLIQGIFDGQGYTIYGLTVSNGGLFGNLASGSQVRNFALVNVTIDAPRGWNPSAIAYYVFGDAVVENVFVHISSVTLTAQTSGTICAFANLIKGDSYGVYPTIQKVVVYIGFEDTTISNTPRSFTDQYSSGNYGSLQNVHVISDYSLFKDNEDAGTNITGDITRYGNGANYASFSSRYSSGTASEILEEAGLSETYWTYSESLGYPVFTTSLGYLTAQS